MLNFVTLNTIITDLLNTIRGSKVSRSEPISKRQLESWVHQYRALLLKQDIDKGKVPNSDYIQTLPGLNLIVVDKSENVIFQSGSYILKTELALPKTIDLNFKSGFTYIGSEDGVEIQFVPEGRVSWQGYKKYTNNDNLCFLRDKHLYLILPTPITYLNVRGIFEVPTEVNNFVNPHVTGTIVDLDYPYPIPINMLPVLKEMILKGELGIISQAPSDIRNDSQNIVQPNTKQ